MNTNEFRNVLESNQFEFETILNKFYLSIFVNLPAIEIAVPSVIHFVIF